jgi:hypothetical protein
VAVVPVPDVGAAVLAANKLPAGTERSRIAVVLRKSRDGILAAVLAGPLRPVAPGLVPGGNSSGTWAAALLPGGGGDAAPTSASRMLPIKIDSMDDAPLLESRFNSIWVPPTCPHQDCQSFFPTTKKYKGR